MESIIQLLCIMALPLIFAITLHEAAHGYVAHRLGDSTAYLMGRVSLNPAKHIDPVGTIALPLLMLVISKGAFVFGFAKPVPVNFNHLKQPRRDAALVALAGPAANVLMACLWGSIAKLALVTHSTAPMIRAVQIFFIYSGAYGILINCLLCVLNLIPLPPLDGSRILASLLPVRTANHYLKIEPYGVWILLAIIVFAGHIILLPPTFMLSHWISTMLGFNFLSVLNGVF